MPSPSSSGTWTRARLSLYDATVALRQMLAGCRGCGPEVNLGVHSAKATVLSWCAKAGLSVVTRKFLGGHAQGADDSVLSYSRDALAGPLMELKTLLGQIRDGVFLPDEDRSGRWAVPMLVPLEVQAAAESGAEESSGSSSSSSSTDSEEEGQQATVEVDQLVSQEARQHRPPVRGRLWKHAARGTYHFQTDVEGRKFDCGRRITEAFQSCPTRPKNLVPRCGMCFQTSEAVGSDEEANLG